MKKIQNLDQSDLDAIAEEIFRNNTWFDHHGNMITLAMLRAEIIGAAYDRAERCDAANVPCMVVGE